MRRNLFAQRLRMMGLARRHRTVATSLIYAVIATAAYTLAYVSRGGFHPDRIWSLDFGAALGVLVVIRLVVNYALRLGMGQWRYVGNRDYVRLVVAESIGSLIFFAVTTFTPFLPNVPPSIVLLEWAFNGYGTAMTWVLYRLLFERYQVRQASSRTRVLIVGAGEAGELLVSQMVRSKAGYLPVGIVDDSPVKWGTHVHGVQVVGPPSEVADYAIELAAEEIVIGIPSASANDLRRIVQCCEATELPLKILPGMEEVLTGTATLSRVRDVRIEDLLGRDPIRLELPELAEKLVDKVVLVTGAAGSIGSELVRQIALHHPRRLVLLDQAETPLYYLELDVLRSEPPFEVVTIVGSVTDPSTVERVIRTYSPDVVYHAAAYKHVPLMESNPEEAVRTNVLGTYLIADAAARGRARAFILVSTDKAARPASVMGATKQMAERVMLHLQSRYPDCAFGAVRFGNVLGSAGSVIPLFRRQLERGDPLTVTDENATRYFMTIPEAVQLILQASLLEDLRGRVAMLDMGEPVRIADLARDLLRLSGHAYRPGRNVVITGLRPGEKLHEELVGPGEQIVATSLDRVFKVHTESGFAHLPAGLERALRDGDVAGIRRSVLEVLDGHSAAVAAANGAGPRS